MLVRELVSVDTARLSERFGGFEMESRELLQLCPEREGSMVVCRVACLATIENMPWEDVL